jgi:hypothetical protein
VRLRDTMDRFAYPTATHLLEYSMSAGVTEATGFDDANRLILRAENALNVAQCGGIRQFYACPAGPASDVDDSTVVPRPLVTG